MRQKKAVKNRENIRRAKLKLFDLFLNNQKHPRKLSNPKSSESFKVPVQKKQDTDEFAKMHIKCQQSPSMRGR